MTSLRRPSRWACWPRRNPRAIACWNAPFEYDEYCTQLMYSCTGSVDGSRVPPKLEFPSQVLKCIAMPCEAFCVYSVTLAPVTLRTCAPSMSQAM